MYALATCAELPCNPRFLPLQGVDSAGTETKGTVLLTSAEELQTYHRSEEDKLESYVKAVADSGKRQRAVAHGWLLCCTRIVC